MKYANVVYENIVVWYLKIRSLRSGICIVEQYVFKFERES